MSEPTWLDKTVERLAAATELPQGDVKAQIAELMSNNGLTEKAAVAQWQSNPKNSRRLSRAKLESYRVRVIGKREPHEVNTKQGKTIVSEINVLVDQGGKIPALGKITLWGDQARYEDFRLGSGYSVKSRFQAATGQLQDVREITQDDTAVGLNELGKMAAILSISEADQHVGSDQIMKGTVGRIIQNASGVKFGVEVSDPDAPEKAPVPVFTSRDSGLELKDILENLRIGEDVYVYGYIVDKNGEPKVNARGIFSTTWS